MTAARDYVIRHGKPDDAVVREIVERIVETAQPDRILLFGSAARADMGAHSDLDLLVIKSGEYDRARLEGDLYVAMSGIGIATDIVLVTPEQVETIRIRQVSHHTQRVERRRGVVQTWSQRQFTRRAQTPHRQP